MPSALSTTALFFALLGAVAAQDDKKEGGHWKAPPLAEITGKAPERPPPSVATTFAPGAQPTHIPGAPALPDYKLDASKYPTPGEDIPLDSEEVKKWVSEIDWSKVPKYKPNKEGATCADNKEASDDPERCWWTCTQCTRDTDIVDCPEKQTWGLTFDDGPSEFTPVVLNYLNENKLTATFFLIGANVLEHPDIMITEYMTGHQLSVHTWTHPFLTSLSNEAIVAELGWSAKIIKDVIGVTPNTFRPPYGDIDDRVRAIAQQMGFTPIMWTTHAESGNSIDTNDWAIPDGKVTGAEAMSTFQGILNSTVPTMDRGFIALEHDIYPQTVDLAAGYLLPWALDAKYKLSSVAACHNTPLSEAYKETAKGASGDKPPADGDKPAADGDKPAADGDKAEGDKAEGDKTEGDKDEGDKTEGDKPAADKQEGDKTDKTEDKPEDKKDGDSTNTNLNKQADDSAGFRAAASLALTLGAVAAALAI